MALVRDELGHKSISTTERYCDILFKRLQDDFPTYATAEKVLKNGNKERWYSKNGIVKPSKMELPVGK